MATDRGLTAAGCSLNAFMHDVSPQPTGRPPVAIGGTGPRPTEAARRRGYEPSSRYRPHLCAASHRAARFPGGKGIP